MKAERSNASTERILALLVLLLHGEHSRSEIYTAIAAYNRGATPSSMWKMLERDLSTLERAGLQVERSNLLKGWTTYHIPPAQFQLADIKI